MTWQPDVQTSSVFVTLVLQSIIGLVLYLLFEYCRNQMEIFWPKRRTNNARCPTENPSPYPLGWLWPILHISDDETLRMVGTDGFILLRFLRLCTTVCLGCGTFALAFLLPIYATGFGTDESIGIDRLTMANITAGGDRLWAPLICTWIFTLVILFYLYKEYEHFVLLRHKFLTKGDPDLPTQQLYTVVVENIPKGHQTSEKLFQLFEKLFPGEVVSAQIGINDKTIVKADTKRAALIAKLESAVAQYEASGREDKPMVSVKAGKVVMCRGDSEEEAIPYYMAEIQRMNVRIQTLKQEAKEFGAGTVAMAERLSLASPLPGDPAANRYSLTASAKVHPTFSAPASPQQSNKDEIDGVRMFSEDIEAPSSSSATALIPTPNSKKNAGAGVGASGKKKSKEEEEDAVEMTDEDLSGTGFVTFRNKRTQLTASQVDTLSADFRSLKALPATIPSNMIWANTNVPLSYIRVASTATRCLYYTGLVFWAAILAFIAAISSLSNLEKYLPFLKDLDPITYGLLEGQLPVLALIIFIALLPMIFTAVSTYIERRKQVSEVRLEVFTW